MIFIMHSCNTLELKLYQTRKKNLLSAAVFLYLSDSGICLSNNGWNVIKMARSFVPVMVLMRIEKQRPFLQSKARCNQQWIAQGYWLYNYRLKTIKTPWYYWNACRAELPYCCESECSSLRLPYFYNWKSYFKMIFLIKKHFSGK